MGWMESEVPEDGGEVEDAKCPEAGFFLYRLKISRGENFTGASAAASSNTDILELWHLIQASTMMFFSAYLYSSSDDRTEDGLSFLRQRINTISCLGRGGGLSGDR